MAKVWDLLYEAFAVVLGAKRKPLVSILIQYRLWGLFSITDAPESTGEGKLYQTMPVYWMRWQEKEFTAVTVNEYLTEDVRQKCKNCDTLG